MITNVNEHNLPLLAAALNRVGSGFAADFNRLPRPLFSPISAANSLTLLDGVPAGPKYQPAPRRSAHDDYGWP